MRGRYQRPTISTVLETQLIVKYPFASESGERTLEMAVRRMNLSARVHDRLLRVARTIADLDKATNVAAKHLAEAVQCRNLDRNYWN